MSIRDLRLRVRTLYYRDAGIRNAPAILARNISDSLGTIGKRLQGSARARMRKDTEATQKSLLADVKGRGLSINLLVVSELVQAFVDEYGLPRGVFPDFGINSRLYGWVKRHPKSALTKGRKVKGNSPAGPSVPRELRQRRKFKTRVGRRGGTNKTPISSNARLSKKQKDLKRSTFLVARAIHDRGIAPTHPFKKTMESNRSYIIRTLQRAMDKSAREISKG